MNGQVDVTGEQQLAADHRARASARRLLPADGRSAALGRLTDLAARLLSRPSAPVSVQVSLRTDVQTVPAASGVPAGTVGSTSRLEDSLCTVTVNLGGPLVIDDTRADARVSQLPPVTSAAVGAYLGVPLAADDVLVGSLCAYGPEPRDWSSYDVAVLEELAGAALAQLELEALSADYTASRTRWDAAIEAAGIGSFDRDLATGRLDWDERLQTIFGYQPGEFAPDRTTVFDRMHPEDRAGVQATVAAAIESRGNFRAEFRIVLPDGSTRWVAAQGRVTSSAHGKAIALVGTAQDVTQARTARDEAARLVDTMAIGFVAVDRDWRVTYLNDQGARAIGMTAEEVVGRSLWEAFPGLEELEFGRLYKHSMATGETTEVESFYGHLDAWFEVRAVPASGGLSLFFLDVTERHVDKQRAEMATARLELLASVSAELAAAGLNIERAIAKLSELVVPVLADWCVVSFAGEGGQLPDVGHWHRDPALRPVLATYVAERLEGRRDLGSVQRARDTREPVIVASGLLQAALPTLGSETARQALRQLAPESVVVVPMTARGHMTAVLSLVRGADRPPMSEEEIVTACEVASHAALGLDNARLFAEQSSLAEGLQRSLLTTPPEPDHCQITVRYVPAAEAASVGGDWFDSFLQADGATVLVIGDVMGHDTVAAAAMGQVRSLLRGIAWHSGSPPADVLAGLDAAMLGLQLNTTATAVIARLEQSPDERERGITRLRWSNAGHPPPMAINPDGSVFALAGTEADLLLGIDPATPRSESVIVLDRGSTVLLYTDGLVERRGQDLDDGLAVLRRTLGELAPLPLEELCDRLLERMMPQGSNDDDVAIVAVRLHRQDEPRPPEAGPARIPPDVPAEP